MRLFIISNMAHYERDGQVVGWGPTVQEIDALAQIFNDIRHIGCLYPSPAPPSALPYSSERVHFIGVPPAGGKHLKDKLGILRLSQVYFRAMLKEIPKADVVHVRCPANISLLAIVLLAFLRHPKYRWVKYAGNWRPNGREAWSYTFQRWWLNKGLHRGVVTVNGRWSRQPKHVYSFLNPCLTCEEVESARTIALSKELSPPYNLLFVGRVESTKGVGRLLKITKELHRQGIPIKVDIVGDGPERKDFEAWTKENGLPSFVTFHGWMPKPALAEFYNRAHFFVFPSSASEGWPKVLSEAMAYGAVLIAGAVSSIPQVLSETGAGLSFPPDDIHAFVQAILDFIDQPERWRAASQAGVAAAPLFTYEHYLEKVKQMFWDAWRVRL